MIEGVGRVNNMEEVAMTCANMCSVQLVMIDIAAVTILYQFAWKVIWLIENKKTNLDARQRQSHRAPTNVFYGKNSLGFHAPHILLPKLHQHEQDRIRRR